MSGWTTDGAGEEHIFTFTTPYNIVDGNQYCYEYKCLDAPTANRPIMRGAADAYSGGIASYSDNSGATWENYSSWDFYFQNWGTVASTPVVYPNQVIIID
jgi:hypothetical protein